MKAMLLHGVENINRNHSPLILADIPKPEPGKGEVLIKVAACGVCHTELDEIEGRTPPPSYPVVPGHQVVGSVEKFGSDVDQLKKGDRVGVAWIYSACGECYHCKEGEENLCSEFTATGRDKNGGYAEYMTVPAAFVYPIPDELEDEEAAPLLCAGAIGYRSLSLTNMDDGKRLGLTGFGASGHLVLRMARYLYPNSDFYVFARNPDEREFALELGARWAGDTEATAPEPLHAIIDTTPVWKPDVEALRNLAPGGRLVINAIRKENSDIYYLEKIDYSTHLWMEKEIKSVANVTREDVRMMLNIAVEAGIRPDVQTFPLEKANDAIMEIKQGKIKGGKVLKIG